MSSRSYIRWRSAAAILAAAGLATACSTVSLGNYTPPPIQSPGGASSGASAGGAETHPVTEAAIPSAVPEQPVVQPSSNFGGAPATEQTNPDQGLSSQQPMNPPPMNQGGVGAGATANQNANLVALQARLDGASVVPRVATVALGNLVAQYDRTSRLLRWKATWSDLSSPIIGVQFRGPADLTLNAPIAVTWPAPYGVRYDGNATLTVTQADDLLHGLWYVTVQTANYPQGELRGQLQVVN